MIWLFVALGTRLARLNVFDEDVVVVRQRCACVLVGDPDRKQLHGGRRIETAPFDQVGRNAACSPSAMRCSARSKNSPILSE